METKEPSPHPVGLQHKTVLTSRSLIKGVYDDLCVICQVTKSLHLIFPQDWPLIFLTNVYTGLILSFRK